jgi:hypothetical protein
MNEEMRKEFEEWIIKSNATGRVPNFIMKSENGTYIDPQTSDLWQAWQVLWQAWQASRQAMKPIEFPAEIELDLIGDQVAPTHQNSYAEWYNDALSDLLLKITELGYKVEV